MGEQLGLPLISVLLPEVRAGSGPPAAASLLAALLKRFPQHAALPVTPDAGAASLPAGPGVAGGAAALPHEVAEATGPAGSGEGAAGAPMEGGAGQQLGGEMAALRLQQSATYTIESMLRCGWQSMGLGILSWLCTPVCLWLWRAIGRSCQAPCCCCGLYIVSGALRRRTGYTCCSGWGPMCPMREYGMFKVAGLLYRPLHAGAV